MSTTVQCFGTTDTNVAHGRAAQVQQGICTVRHCTDESGPLPWPTENALSGWPTTWAVCSYHYWQLDTGKACTRVNENEPATNRWLLMAEDV